MSEIISRIKDSIEALKLTPNAFASKAAIDPSNFGKMLDGKQKITEKTITKLCQAHGISAEWVKSGEGDMFVPQSTTTKGVFFSPEGIYAEDSEVVVGDAVLRERIKYLIETIQTLQAEKRTWELERKRMQKDIEEQRKRIDQLTDKLLELK